MSVYSIYDYPEDFGVSVQTRVSGFATRVFLPEGLRLVLGKDYDTTENFLPLEIKISGLVQDTCVFLRERHNALDKHAFGGQTMTNLDKYLSNREYELARIIFWDWARYINSATFKITTEIANRLVIGDHVDVTEWGVCI